MSKITKKDIRRLIERYEGTIQSHKEQMAVLHERVETLREMIDTLKHLVNQK